MDDNKEIVLITGCASGIGRELASVLAKRESRTGKSAYHVYATDKKLEALKGLQAGNIDVLELDVLSEASIKTAVDHILAKAGKIDLLVLNAGVHCGGFMAEIDYADVERTFDINVHGTFRVVQAVGPHMMAQRKGVIATMCDVQSWFARPFNAPYEGSKASIALMSEGLSLELASYGVSVSSVYAGWVRTQLLQNGLTDFNRYGTRSYYHSVVDYFRKMLADFAELGPSAQDAANDIANNLTKSKPPRFIYTGASVWSTLWAGFAQQWISNGLFARRVLSATGLNRLSIPAAGLAGGPKRE